MSLPAVQLDVPDVGMVWLVEHLHDAPAAPAFTYDEVTSRCRRSMPWGPVALVKTVFPGAEVVEVRSLRKRRRRRASWLGTTVGMDEVSVEEEW